MAIIARTLRVIICLVLPCNRATLDQEFFDTPLTCQSYEDCKDVHSFAVCDVSQMTTSQVNQTEGRCRCDAERGWLKYQDTCIVGSRLGYVCDDEESWCSTPNTECRDAGMNTNQKRCVCQRGFIEVQQIDGLLCGKVVTKADVSECESCENNEGTCYVTSGNTTEVGCQCPVSRSGSVCERLHVFVSCDLESFSMQVCYEPHEGVDFDSGAALFTDGNGMQESCRAKLVSSGNNHCRQGQQQLVLPLADSERAKCGTVKQDDDGNVLRYENRLIVQNQSESTSSADIIFDVFCSFKTQAQMSFKPIAVVGLNGNDRGEHKQPGLTIFAENHLGRRLQSGEYLQLDDPIRFRILLEDDGTYSAVRIKHCTASSSPSIPDYKAATLQLVVNGCPARGQQHVTEDNNWRRRYDQPNELETGLIKMFKLTTSHSLFLHCSVELCLKTSESQCQPISCASSDDSSDSKDKATSPSPPTLMSTPPSSNITANGSQSMTRRKRSVSDKENRDVTSSEIKWIDGTNTGLMMTQGGLAALLVIMTLLLVVFLALSVLLVYRFRTQSSGLHLQSGFRRPQRFALPRLPHSLRL